VSTQTNTKAPGVAAAAQPKDAAAVILLRETAEGCSEVFWVRRSQKLAFLGGFYAFAGGQRDATDDETRVENALDAEAAAMISCAARELFEELGVLVARGAQTLTKRAGPSSGFARRVRRARLALRTARARHS